MVLRVTHTVEVLNAIYERDFLGLSYFDLRTQGKSRVR